MSQEEGNEHTPSATPSRSGSSGSGDEASGSPATQNEAGEQHAGPLLPHQLIPAHIKDKEKVDVRRGMLKTATKELGALLQSFQSLQESSSLQDSSSSSEELAAAVLCSKLMKRRTLLCCKADPQQPDTRLLRPLQVLCEAKVSAASPAFIKCSCDSCSSSGSSSFNSVREFAAHARQVTGQEAVVVEAQSELSWQVRHNVLVLDLELLGFSRPEVRCGLLARLLSFRRSRS
uniref:Uncharacterized protein n=1 Tax=Tetradesmus obliquus TaxID=3088 RepID=A0A383W120_TETOB|eukprot:jgi/Sobl393_1/17568/SZX71388.1